MRSKQFSFTGGRNCSLVGTDDVRREIVVALNISFFFFIVFKHFRRKRVGCDLRVAAISGTFFKF